jgi:hypothetical protein
MFTSLSLGKTRKPIPQIAEPTKARHSVLMVTPYVPYKPVSGGRARTYNLIQSLARDFKITLLCLAS